MKQTTRRHGRTRSLRRAGAGLLATAALLTTAACGGGGDGGGDEVTVGLSSPMGPSWAAFAVGQEQGYFADEGLSIDLQFPGASGDVLQSMAVGRTDIGAPSADAVFAGLEQGQDVTMTYGWTRGTVSALGVKQDSPIQSFADLDGLKIGVPSLASGTKVLADACLELAGLTPDDVDYVAVGTGSSALDALQRDRVDALMLYDTEFASMANSGADLRTFIPDELSTLFSTIFATSDDWLQSNEETMEGFGRAWTKATVWAIANPEEAIREMWEVYPETKTSSDTEELLEDQVAIFEARMKYVTKGDPEANDDFGAFSDSAVADWTTFAADYGVTSEKLSPDDLYTNDYVDFYNDFDLDAVKQDAAAS